jgi:hypothetical protein
MTFLSTIFITQIKKSALFNRQLWLLFFIAGLCFFAPLQAQTLTGSPSGKFVDVYGGGAITTLGPGMVTGITVRNGGHQFIIRGVSTDLKPDSETWEIAGLYGRVLAINSFEFSAGAGVGVIGGRGYSQLFAVGKQESFETMIGFPLDGRITWKPVTHAGISLYSFANINTVQPIGGLALTLHLGF